MKKIAALCLLATLTFGSSLPTFARTAKTHNKYQGLDPASRRAQKKEQKAMDRYAKSQRRAQHKMLKTQKKKTTYKPKQF
jgi:hypothetical protein